MHAKIPNKVTVNFRAVFIILFTALLVFGTIALQRHYFPDTYDASAALQKADELLKEMPPDSAVDDPAASTLPAPAAAGKSATSAPAGNAAAPSRVDMSVRPVAAGEKESGAGNIMRIVVTPADEPPENSANSGEAGGQPAIGSSDLLPNQPRTLGGAPRELPSQDSAKTAATNALATVEPLELMRQLRGDDAQQQETARNELIRRGFTQVDLELARQLLDPSVEVRKRLAVALPRLGTVDPVPWLLWLGQDPEPSVRFAALSTLGTTGDPSLLVRVEQLARDDRDPQVQSLARQITRQLEAASHRGEMR